MTIWAIILGYFIFGVLIARYVRILLLRQAVEHQRKRERHLKERGGFRASAFCYDGYYGTCSKCSTIAAESYNIYAFMSFLAWPVVFAVLIGIGFGKLIEKLILGLIQVVKIFAHTFSPLWRFVAAVNRWFWQDPQDRKKSRKTTAY